VVAASILVLILIGGSALTRGDAAVLLLAFAAYFYWVYRTERFHGAASAEVHVAEGEEVSAVPKSVIWIALAILLGLVLLIGGSRVLLTGAVGLASYFGASQAVIGLTLVAVGTSLPELSVSVIAALRRHADVAVGNILGSNIFNLLGILGLSALMQPLPIHRRILQFDQWVLLGTSLVLLLFLYTGKRLSRAEGAVLLAGYGIYLGFSFVEFSV